MTAVVDRRVLRIGACLSLTGRYSRFGRQAADGLEAWRGLDGDVELVVEDDGSDPARVEPCLRAIAGRCDLLLGPYSTQLMRAASRVARDLNHLVWNHGGSGDDVEAAAPGHVVSVLSPTSRYAEPFLRHLAGQTRAPLWLVEGRGSFGRQVVAGAQVRTETLGLRTVRIGPADALPTHHALVGWDLFCAGSFEEDVARVTAALALARPPRLTGTVPDYPAVQAATAAVLAAHSVRIAGSTARESLWAAAAGLLTTTMFGSFRIDPVSGAQLGHETTLVRWTRNGLASASLGHCCPVSRGHAVVDRE